MTGEKQFPLGAPSRMNSSAVCLLPGGRIQFTSSDGCGAGILRFDDMLPWCSREGIRFPAVVRVGVAISGGQIYGQYFDRQFRAPITPATSSKYGDKHIYLYLEQPKQGAVLMIGAFETPTSGEITEIAIAPREIIDPAEYKRIRAAMFAHWYYSCDLKDGVVWAATLPDERAATTGARNNVRIMLKMIEQHFGSVDGLKILDVACSAGLHSFELARLGALVTAIDWDSAAIAQAKFIQECICDELRNPVDFRCTDLFSFEAPPRSFDLVYCSGLFYHLQDPIGAARKLATLCRRGGVMQCCVTAREGNLLELSDPAKFPFCASWEFALVPTATMLFKILESAGFAVADMLDISEFFIDEHKVIEQRFVGNTTRSGPVYLALKACHGDQQADAPAAAMQGIPGVASVSDVFAQFFRQIVGVFRERMRLRTNKPC